MIPALGKQRQMDQCELEPSLVFIVFLGQPELCRALKTKQSKTKSSFGLVKNSDGDRSSDHGSSGLLDAKDARHA